MTHKELTEIRARAEAATPGPWIYKNGEVENADGGGGAWIFHDGDYPGTGDFIAHARNDVPALVDEVERLREALKRIIKACMPHEEPVSRMIARAALEGK